MLKLLWEQLQIWVFLVETLQALYSWICAVYLQLFSDLSLRLTPEKWVCSVSAVLSHSRRISAQFTTSSSSVQTSDERWCSRQRQDVTYLFCCVYSTSTAASAVTTTSYLGIFVCFFFMYSTASSSWDSGFCFSFFLSVECYKLY